MLSPLTTDGSGEVLASLSAVVFGRLHPVPVGDEDQSDGWVEVDALLDDPDRILALVEASGRRRFACNDLGLVLAQVARESISVLVTAGVDLWGRQRRLLDLTAGNVLLREGELGTVVGVRRLRFAVLPDDPLAPLADGTNAEPAAAGAAIEVMDEAKMLRRLVDRTIGHPVPSGAVPRGRPDQVAAAAAIVAAVRRIVRCGPRHLWGTAALAASTALTRVSHMDGKQADRDRAALYDARPDLRRTVDLVTACDGANSTLTFAVRRTCCLMYKLPAGGQCATCSLRDRDVQVAELTTWYRTQRAEQRTNPQRQ